MSRTVRRKGMRPSDLPKWVTHDWDTIDGIWKQVPYEGKELNQILAKQRSDLGYNIDRTDAPKYYRQDLNRHYRLRMNRETRRVQKYADYDGYFVEPQSDIHDWD